MIPYHTSLVTYNSPLATGPVNTHIPALPFSESGTKIPHDSKFNQRLNHRLSGGNLNSVMTDAQLSGRNEAVVYKFRLIAGVSYRFSLKELSQREGGNVPLVRVIP